jgi:hypothetical protein
MNFKKSQLRTEFGSKIKICWAHKINFLFRLKYPFCCPLDYAAWDGVTTSYPLKQRP